MTSLRIAIVGAESTGKSTLARALTQRLADEFGLRAVEVPEVLRQWCAARDRTPRVDEQRGIALLQQQRMDDATASADVVICDTTPLMIAVYSRIVFGDDTLVPMARHAHTTIDFTLLTGLDLPWVADGLQRDGPQVRQPVDRLVRGHLLDWGCDWAVVLGTGEARTSHAVDALRPVLAAWSQAAESPRKLFSSLVSAGIGPARLANVGCERCDERLPGQSNDGL